MQTIQVRPVRSKREVASTWDALSAGGGSVTDNLMSSRAAAALGDADGVQRYAIYMREDADGAMKLCCVRCKRLKCKGPHDHTCKHRHPDNTMSIDARATKEATGEGYNFKTSLCYNYHGQGHFVHVIHRE